MIFDYKTSVFACHVSARCHAFIGRAFYFCNSWISDSARLAAAPVAELVFLLLSQSLLLKWYGVCGHLNSNFLGAQQMQCMGVGS